MLSRCEAPSEVDTTIQDSKELELTNHNHTYRTLNQRCLLTTKAHLRINAPETQQWCSATCTELGSASLTLLLRCCPRRAVLLDDLLLDSLAPSRAAPRCIAPCHHDSATHALLRGLGAAAVSSCHVMSCHAMSCMCYGEWRQHLVRVQDAMRVEERFELTHERHLGGGDEGWEGGTRKGEAKNGKGGCILVGHKCEGCVCMHLRMSAGE